MQYSTHYRDWSFIGVPRAEQAQERHLDRDTERPLTATCVEGIAVEFQTPGFSDGGVLAIANAVGERAPKTNVARSSIEATDEKENLARTVYTILFDAVASEINRLRSEEAYSLTWAIEQLPFIIGPILGARPHVQYPRAHREALEKVPMFLIDHGNTRTNVSLLDRASLFILLYPIDRTRFSSKILLKRSHVKLQIDARRRCGTVHGNLANAVGFAVASSRHAEFRKSLSDQWFTVFPRGNFGLDLETSGQFWTADSLLIRSVENFIREAKAEVTAGRLLVVSQGTSTSLPQGALLSNYHSTSMLRNVIDNKFEISKIVGNTAERRLAHLIHRTSRPRTVTST